MKQNIIYTTYFGQEDHLESGSNETNEVKLKNISPEGYKEYSILEIKDISSFIDDKFEKLNQLNNMSYYLKRNIIDDILNSEEPITPYLEVMLANDDTYNKLQEIYLDELIKKINTKNIDKLARIKICEKIEKSSIILSQSTYEKKN